MGAGREAGGTADVVAAAVADVVVVAGAATGCHSRNLRKERCALVGAVVVAGAQTTEDYSLLLGPGCGPAVPGPRSHSPAGTAGVEEAPAGVEAAEA